MSGADDPARALDLLAQALTLPVGERDGFLEQVAGDDPALHGELRALLAADRRAEGFLEPPQPADRAGERVGAWRLLRLLGRGGMGEVWLGERDDGLYQARVAIKFLRPGLAAGSDRFARERRVLAELAHPNIARLVDAGHDGRGLPWVAMDHVDGLPLDAWCRQRAASVRERVALLLKVVEAVAFAHARLVVHRDLKPANILVDGAGEPHLLDFGIAKLLDEAEPGLTIAGAVPMTPEYASPEQLEGKPVGVASDVWSLGAIGHELLAGALPHEAGSRRTGGPTRPPGLPSRIAASRGLRLPRDLDHVLLKALAPAPADRYRDCAALAADLRRYLAGRPVRARAAGRGYRTWRFLVRHRWPVALASAVALALAASTAFSLLQARDARRQAALAAQAQERTTRLNDFLQELLAAPDPARDGREVTVAEVLDRAAARLADDFEGQPQLRAQMHITLARSYHGLGRTGPAQAQALAAIGLLEGTPPADPARLASVRVLWAHMLSDRGRFAEAREQLARAREVIVADDDELAAQLENLLGTTSANLQDYEAAGRHYQRSLAILRRVRPTPVEGLAVVLNNLGSQAYKDNDGAAAIGYREEALALLRGAYPGPHPQTLLVLGNYADDLELVGRAAEAEQVRRAIVADSRAVNGPGHPRTLGAEAALAQSLLERGRAAEAEALARATLDLANSQQPLPAREAGIAMVVRVEALAALGRGAEALALVPALRSLREDLYPDGHPARHEVDRAEGVALVAAGERSRGLALLGRAVAAFDAGSGPGHPYGQRARVLLARLGGSPPGR